MQNQISDHLLKIEGRSGCPLKVFASNGKVLLRKTSSSLDYNSRLTKQAEKQSKFNQLNSLDFFDSPIILNQGTTTNGLNYFDMEYIRGEKFSDFLCRISVNQIQTIIKYLINYLDYYFSLATYTKPSMDKINEKIVALEKKLKSSYSFSNRLKRDIFLCLRSNIPQSKLYQIYCHGDMTFSNMLFSMSGKIYLIDFLDSFIESPLVDLVKLRQDTRFFWSVEIDSDLEKYKICKIKQILSYIDKNLNEYLSQKGEDVYNWYRYLELFNLVRIMPYVKREQEVKFLDKHIKELLLSYV